MDSLDTKKELILAQERKFAAQLGRLVLNKPQLSSWMIFIPFIFIFYIQDLMKYKKGRREFSSNYLLSREKALNEAIAVVTENRKPDTMALASQADLKENAIEKYGDLLAVLAGHYILILKAHGESYEDLVRSAHSNNGKAFLAFSDRLSSAEKSLNKALIPGFDQDSQGVKTTIKNMETCSERLRRAEAKQLFST
jgi:hypothetical protein